MITNTQPPMKRISFLLIFLCSYVLSQAQTWPRVVSYGAELRGPGMKAQIEKNPCVSACNHYAYPGPKKEKLTPTPKGYEPFYFSSYARHGSRWLIGEDEYSGPYETLLKADSLGKLTQLGKQTLEKLRRLNNASYLRLGELTLLGAQQHRGIAQRMFRNFPEIFSDDAKIDARSTTVFRVALSMENELQELCKLNPNIQILHDASEADMYYLNRPQRYLDSTKFRPEVQKVYDKFCEWHETAPTVMPRLFNDDEYWRTQIDASKLNNQLFKVAGNLQSTELRHQFTLYDIFTEDELYENWLKTNAWWYIAFGPSPLNEGKQPFTQHALLRNFIETADTCLVKDRPTNTLRFGHEVDLLPFVCLLEIDNFGQQIYDLNKLDLEGWQSHRIFPMACNVQMIFYRNKKNHKDILVKVLLNENEAFLPLPQDHAPYYSWVHFRSYYMSKLKQFDEWLKTADRKMN